MLNLIFNNNLSENPYSIINGDTCVVHLYNLLGYRENLDAVSSVELRRFEFNRHETALSVHSSEG